MLGIWHGVVVSTLGYHFGWPRFDSPPRPGCTSSLLPFSSRLQHFINSLRRRLHSSINQTSKQFLMLTAKGAWIKKRCIYHKMMTTKLNLRYLDRTRPWTEDKQSNLLRLAHCSRRLRPHSHWVWLEWVHACCWCLLAAALNWFFSPFFTQNVFIQINQKTKRCYLNLKNLKIAYLFKTCFCRTSLKYFSTVLYDLTASHTKLK